MVIDGILYAIGSFAGGILAAWLTGLPLIATPFFVFGAFCMYFFRDPDRVAPAFPEIVSPADGKVMAVKLEDSGLTRVSIFLNVFDVHVNRSPVAGRVADVQYHRGQFLVASKELASIENEQNVVTMETADGVRVVYKQIAGLIARRLVFKKKPGDQVAKGERIGLMKFGSRMDVFLPLDAQIFVSVGQKVVAGETILAELPAGGDRAGEPGRA